MSERNLYIFLDESGNFDFSPKGTKYFILSGFVTSDPSIKREELIKLKYKLISEGIDQEYFHATEDKQFVRNQIYEFLNSIGSSYEVHAVVAQKNKANPILYKESYYKNNKLIERVTGMGFYKKLCECLLKYIFEGKYNKVDKIIIILGSLFNGEKEKVLLKTLKHFIKENFPKVRFEIFWHQVSSDLNCQLTDYCCWAISVMYERGEKRPYEIIKSQIKSIFEIFKYGKKEYYHYEK
jgi:hypothetical protein